MNNNLDTYLSAFLDTPYLWEENTFKIAQFIIPNIDIKTLSPTPIPNNIRLGHQIEYLFLQLINHSKVYTILIHNLPIRNATRTLGEIDFIVEHKLTKQLTHVELTYKFYIIDLSENTIDYQLIGPNKKDAFFTKMNKINTTQFPLLQTPEAIKALKDNGITSDNILQKVCFKAQLFSPYKKQLTYFKHNKDCIVGFWVNYIDFLNDEFKLNQFYIPTKKEWLLVPHKNVEWKNYDITLEELKKYKQQQKSPLIWRKVTTNTFEKFFIIWW